MSLSAILDTDISIIVQGPVYSSPDPSGKESITQRVISSIRKYFPRAEVVLSTWEGSNVDGLDHDVLILNKDPGSFIRDERSKYYHNVNRQIVSTLSGLKAASRTYTLKTRTDVIFTHNRCLGYLQRFPNRSNNYRLTKERVLITSVTSVNPMKLMKLPYHPCDWFYFGLKEDLIDIFDIPFFPEPEFTHWYKTREYPENHPNFVSTSRYPAESYIWYSFCKKHATITFEHLCDISSNNIEISEKIFANNVVILEPSQLGIISLKNKFNYGYLQNMYTFNEWKKLYNKYCNGTLPVFFDYYRHLYKIRYYINRLRARTGLK